MLGDEHYVLDSPRLQGLHPLLRVELRGIEYFRVGGAVAPLLVEKSVGAEVNNRAHFQILPFDLLRRGFYIGEVLRVAAGGDNYQGSCEIYQEEENDRWRSPSGRHAQIVALKIALAEIFVSG